MSPEPFREPVVRVHPVPDDLILCCGMSIGFEDTTMSHARIDRAPLADTVTFLDR